MSPAKCETVLVVDDHPDVRGVFAEFLRELGYAVLTADGPRQAQGFACGPTRIDLLLTDFRMPEMNGVQLAHWFQVHSPSTKVLLISGSPCDVTGPLDFPLLDKATAFAGLRGTVRDLLASPVPVQGDSPRAPGHPDPLPSVKGPRQWPPTLSEL